MNVRKLTIALVFGGAGLLLNPQITNEPSKAELFGLELQRCAEAHSKGKPDKCALYGKIQFVEHFPDVKIQVVEHFPDIKVKMVEHFPDKPGKWKLVEHFPDYKVQLVEHFPDYKIKYVEHFPGCE
jgi:hypothetical protein